MLWPWIASKSFIHYETWPSYLRINEVIHTRLLRSNIAKRLVVPLEKGTFQDNAAQLFNSLPVHIRPRSNVELHMSRI